MQTKDVDMCSGNIFTNIWRFSVPFIIMGVIQNLYNTIDVMVVGRYAGQESLAGVGTTVAIITFVLNLFVGLSAGVCVVVGREIGAGNKEDVRRTVQTAACISVLLGAAISIMGFIFTENLLNMIDVPKNVMPHAKKYLQIVFCGEIFVSIYNLCSAVLRAKGDTKRPLYIVAISGIMKVLLNLLFVLGFGMKEGGVGISTVISQMFMAVTVVFILCKERDATKLQIKEMRIYKEQFIDIIKIGVPSGIQGMVFSFSSVLVQASVNAFGSAAIAGSAAATNIGNFYYAALTAFSHAAMSFVSQNVGARKYNRIPQIIKCCVIDVVIVGGVVAIITIFATPKLISIYVPGDIEAIGRGTERQLIVGCSYWLCGLMEIMSGVLRGMGRSVTSMIISITGVCGIRIVWLLTAAKMIGTFQSIFISFPLSWFVTFVIYTMVFMLLWRRNEWVCEKQF